MDDRFWAKVDVRGPDECWEWTGARHGKPDRDGRRYGVVKRGGRPRSAHRFAYEDTVGPIPAGLHILHSCDNPSCCNPAHLRPGTDRDNARDALTRGRVHIERGEESATCKFTDAVIARAREFHSLGWSQRRIAKALGISQTYVGQIVRGERRAA